MRRFSLLPLLLFVVCGCVRESASPDPVPVSVALAPATDKVDDAGAPGTVASANSSAATEGAEPAPAPEASPTSPSVTNEPESAAGSPAPTTPHADDPTLESTSAAPASPTAPEPAPALESADIVERVDNGIVLVTIQDPYGNDIGMGSAFVVDAGGLIVTNHHVVEQASRAFAEFQDGKRVAVSGYVAWDVERDLAVLKLAEVPEGVDVLALSSAEGPRRGEEVLAFGHPTGLRFLTTRGIVSAVQETSQFPEPMQAALQTPADTVWIQTDATAAGGSSGGPILNRRGEVIGVTARVAQRANISLSVHVRHVSPLLSNVSTSVVPLTDPRLAADPFVAALGEVDPKVVAIVKDYYRSFEEWRYLLQDVSTPEKHREVMEQHPGREYMDKLISLAEEQRRTPLAFQALLVAHREVARSSPESQVGGSVKRGLALLAEDHVDDERLAPLLILLTSLPTEDTRAFIRTSIERSPHGYCQAVGCYALGQCLAQLPETKEVNDELVGLLERVEAEFADAKYGGTSLIESAKALLYQRKHLGVGRAAPEIESDDVDGGTFKLSDFRGRVVLLDFWGDWCPYCVKMYPQNRLLVEKLKDRPFTLLGVNTDDAARLRRVVDAKKVTWKSWADGPLPGPIATRYQIEGVPTMYVIDGQGVIRFKFGGVVEGPALEEAVESLLAEVEAGSETAPPASDAPTEPATPDAP